MNTGINEKIITEISDIEYKNFNVFLFLLTIQKLFRFSLDKLSAIYPY